MGLAIADELASRGATVHLILGPTELRPTNPSINIEEVMTAQQMFEAAQNVFPKTDIAVLAAAVADYRPVEVSKEKIKKKTAGLTLELIKTVDIAASLGQQKRAGQLLIGFALETNDEENHAQAKLEKKNFDFIVLNSMRDAGAGFGHDTNKISIFRRDGSRSAFDLKSKKAVALDIVNEIARLFPNS